jgi:hypothetical protein
MEHALHEVILQKHDSFGTTHMAMHEWEAALPEQRTGILWP